VTGAQIGRQQTAKDVSTGPGDNYRHAFLIREARKEGAKQQDEVDHILCAESDEERDEWVRVLAAWYTGEYVDQQTMVSRKSSKDEGSTNNSKSSAAHPPQQQQQQHAYDHQASMEQLRDPRHLHHSPHHYPHHRKHDSLGQASSIASVSSQRDSEDSRTLGLSPQSQSQPIPIRRGPQTGLATEIHPSNSLPSNLSDATSPRPASSENGTGAVRSNSELGYYTDIKDSTRNFLVVAPGSSGNGPVAAASHRASSSDQPRDLGGGGHRERGSGGSSDKRTAAGSSQKSGGQGQQQQQQQQLQALHGPSTGTPPSTKISRPMNAVPITAATNFKTRQQKTKSSFWGFAVRNGALFPPKWWLPLLLLESY
jgi:RalA-binding protein 1